jgi:hypothetical protein
MENSQKPDFVFRRNGRVRLNRRGHQFSWLLAAEVCASAVVMLDTPCSEVVWRVLANHSIRQFPLHFLSLASPCAITFQLDSTFALQVNVKRKVSPTKPKSAGLSGWRQKSINDIYPILQFAMQKIKANPTSHTLRITVILPQRCDGVCKHSKTRRDAGGNVGSLSQDRRHYRTKWLIVLYVMCGWASNVPT